MHLRSLFAAASCASAFAFATTAPSSLAADWTSFKIGTLNSYSIGYATLPDGRFVLGTNGGVSVQNTFGSGGQTAVANPDNVTFDPSFVAVRNAASGLIGGGGGFSGTSSLYSFTPASPATPVVRTPLASVQNYCAVYWKHPTSGREGWLVGGTNGSVYSGAFGDANKHNVTFVSNDGTRVGAVTGDLCTYSAGIAVDAAGNLFTSLYEVAGSPAEADAEKVMKFTPDQVDAAVAAVISGTPAPMARGSATLVFQFDSAGSIAVDSLGRLWASGFKVDYLQAYDPATQAARRFYPDHAKLKSALGAPAYQPGVLTHGGINYVSFLATDSFYNFGSDMIFGYRKESDLTVRMVGFAKASQIVTESAGTVHVTVNITPPATARVVVPLSYAGTATRNSDYTAATTSLVFNPGDSSQTLDIKVINDTVDEPVDNETVVVKLGTPSPLAQAGLGAAGTDTFTLTIQDDDVKPQIAAVQSFGAAKVGTAFSYKLVTSGGATTKFTATGLPPGMTIDASTGVISGRPTVPGEYDGIWITASNAAGISTSAGLLIRVADFAGPAHGTFAGYVGKDDAATSGLGGRIDITTTSAATFTGRLKIGGATYALSGVLDTASPGQVTGSTSFKIKGVSHSVDITIDAATGGLSGNLGLSSIIGWRAQTSSSLTGLHNFYAARAGGPTSGDPHGATFGSVTVDAKGNAVAVVHGAEGTVFNTFAPLGPAGEVLVYQSAYAVPGSLLGALSIAGDLPHTLGGTLMWSCPVQTSGGWTGDIPLTAKGGRYRPESGAGIVMSLPAMPGNARIEFQDGGIGAAAASPDATFTLTAPTKTLLPANYSLAISNSTGTFSGSVKVVVNNRPVSIPFQGVIVPDTSSDDPFDGTGAGYFLMPGAGSVVTRSGMVSLVPSAR